MLHLKNKIINKRYTKFFAFMNIRTFVESSQNVVKEILEVSF